MSKNFSYFLWDMIEYGTFKVIKKIKKANVFSGLKSE